MGSSYTIGKLYNDSQYISDTLEDTVRNDIKIKDKTAIPAGKYEIILSMSIRFKKVLPLLLNVPNFEGIRIHSGNTSKDTSGCILLGKNTQIGKVLFSRIACLVLNSTINKSLKKGEKVFITITR